MIRGMHAMFYSSEAEALRTFLMDKLGLAGTDVGGGWLIFDAPEADLGVHPTENGVPRSGTADISFYCDDIATTVAELTGRGVEFTQSVEDHGYGLVTYFKVPGDFVVQLYQPRYSKKPTKSAVVSEQRGCNYNRLANTHCLCPKRPKSRTSNTRHFAYAARFLQRFRRTVPSCTFLSMKSSGRH
ncbi:MAG: VOC family protein [Betaproteobacteria bacterium]